MTLQPTTIQLSLVSHTNTGKTSLLRTLARDVGFGEVSDSAGTTRHVEGLRLMADDLSVEGGKRMSRELGRMSGEMAQASYKLLFNLALMAGFLLKAWLTSRQIRHVARHRQDAAAFGQLVVPHGLEQGRHQLAPGEVAGAAEEHEIEGHDARAGRSGM